MIAVHTAPWAHYVGDGVAWALASGAGWRVHRAHPELIRRLDQRTAPSYFVWLAIGAVIGAWLFGSINSVRTEAPALSHSIAGALAGGIVAVEIWKWRRGIARSTGSTFVLPIAIGIAVGRWGCLFAGLPDGTYGISTTLPWAVDLGDGIGRHPVQIYESLTMALFALVWLGAIHHGRAWPRQIGFHVLIIVYAAQRFCWEWFKPYPPLIGPFNVFHILMLGLIAYGLVWIARLRSAED